MIFAHKDSSMEMFDKVKRLAWWPKTRKKGFSYDLKM
jgi:hypothetical protein